MPRPCLSRRKLAGAVAVAVAVVIASASGALAQAPSRPRAVEPGRPQAPGPGAQRVAVLRIDFQGELPEAARELLMLRLVEGLALARFEVVAGGAADSRLRARGLVAASCKDATCYGQAAGVLSVGYLIVGQVSVKQKNYDITLELVDGRTGATLGQRRERCELCGLEEAGEKMGLAATPLRERLEALSKGPARFVIRSSPAGARVAIDGKAAGRTPIDVELGAGAHSLRLTAAGHEPLDRTVNAIAGVDETLDMTLMATPDRFPYRALGWTGVLVGALALGGAGAAIAVDGNEIACSDAARDDRGHCPYVRNTRTMGAVLAAVGGALVAGGSIALWVESSKARDDDDEPAAPSAPDGGGTGAGMAARGAVIGASWSGRF